MTGCFRKYMKNFSRPPPLARAELKHTLLLPPPRLGLRSSRSGCDSVERTNRPLHSPFQNLCGAIGAQQFCPFFFGIDVGTGYVGVVKSCFTAMARGHKVALLVLLLGARLVRAACSLRWSICGLNL